MHDGTRVQEADNTDPGPPLANTRVKKNVETGDGDTLCPTSEAGN